MKKKLIIIGRVFSCEKGLSGPSSVITALVDELKYKNVDFELLSYDSDRFSKLQYIKLLIKKVLFQRGLIINVHTEGFLLPFIVYLISILNPTHEYYLTIHGIYIIQTNFTNSKIKPIIKLQEKILIKNFPNIICVSEMLKNDIKKLFNRSENVSVVNNGIYIKDKDFKCTSFDMKNIKLIATGGIKKIKGVFEALDIVQYINNKSDIFKVHLDVYGSFDDELTLSEFKSSVDVMKLNDYVSYKGIIKNKDELYEKYEVAQLNMCLSHYDTFNSAVIESMVVGTPSLASSNCGASYLIHNNEDGFIIDMDSFYKEKVYEIIKNHVCNIEEFNFIRKKAYEVSRQYSLSKAAENFINIISKN